MERSDFERLALEQLDALHRAAFQLCKNHATAADLVQDTYLRAIRSAHQFEDRGGGIRPWLFTILHNVFYSRLQKESRDPIFLENISMVDTSTSAPDDPPPAWSVDTIDWDHIDTRITESLDTIDPDTRLALLLWGVEGLKYREIAEVLGVPVGTVMSRLYRARQQLATQLADLPAELGFRIRGRTQDHESPET